MSGNSFYYRKIHSLLGVIPLGFFLIEHLLTNYAAFEGGKAGFNKQVEWLHGLPLLFFLELFFIWLPLLYHGIYGLFIAYQSRNNTTEFSYFRNRMFLLQRVTGVITLIYVFWHFYDTRLQLSLGNATVDTLGNLMHDLVSHPLYFGLYVIGTLAATFHFCNGMWSFLVSWGITVGPRAQRVSTYFWMGAFVIISVLFILSLTAFAGNSFSAGGVNING